MRYGDRDLNRNGDFAIRPRRALRKKRFDMPVKEVKSAFAELNHYFLITSQLVTVQSKISMI
jgi:hypothetical protein